jgi:signal transduction histidine kinase
MAALMGLTLVVLLVQDIPLSFYLRNVEVNRIVTSLERDAFVLAGRSEETLEESTPAQDTMLTELSRAYRDAGGARVVIVNTAGVAIVTSDDDQSKVGDSYASRPEIARALQGEIVSGNRFSTTLGITLLYVCVPIFNGPEVLGAVRLTYPEQVVTDAVNNQLGVLGTVALTTVLLAGVIGWLFSSTVTRRLKFLRDATEKLADGDLGSRADEHSGAPEIRSLATSFNSMAARLSTLIEQQRTFASDASHQLRTPLTALRLRLERARELVESDAPGAAERLLAAEAEADRLGSIIEGLLLLSRAEAHTASRVVVDLAAVAQERLAQWEPLGDEMGITLTYTGPSSAPIWALATAAEQVIDNYIDNAIDVSVRGDTITVTLDADDENTDVHVLDHGPGLSTEGYERAFDRFWRADSDNGGNGLGLAIVAQLARASRGTVALRPRAGGGVDAFARFQTATPSVQPPQPDVANP